MTHDYHEGLPGFDARQIWFDGCEECEQRGLTVPSSLSTLDGERFRRAWKRAADWSQDLEVGHISRAEAPLLKTLWYVQVAFERECRLPLGMLPDMRVTS